MPTPPHDVHLLFAESFTDGALQPFIYLLYKKMSEGHVCLPLAHAARYKKELPASWVGRSLRLGARKGSELLDTAGTAYKPFVLHQDHLYLQRYFQYETRILQRLQAFLHTPPAYVHQQMKLLETNRTFVEELLQDHLPVQEGAANVSWQAAAVLLGVLHPFTIITGGPGTGKTTTVRRLLALLRHLHPTLRVALAAPTGKAAMRIGESLRNPSELDDESAAHFFRQLQPTTLHRLLGWQKNSLYFRHQAQNPLPYDVVVVDECSMIDVALMAKLMDAVGTNTRLILLGDKDQLASVEAGSLLGDLCAIPQQLNTYSERLTVFINSFLEDVRKQIPNAVYPEPDVAHTLGNYIVELRRSHRFRDDEGIGKLSKAVIKSDVITLQQMLQSQDERLQFDTGYKSEVFEQFIEKFRAFIEEPDAASALKKLQQCRVLCAVRQGEQGLYAVNKRIERWLQQQQMLEIDYTFYEHRPIMLTQNRYDLNLYNGDTGIVRKHPDTQELMAYFEDGDGAARWVATAYLQEVETAFALTIHKSQGSEFDEVLILLPSSQEVAIVTRELLYTAITRAKKKVTLQAGEEQLFAAVQRKVERISGVVHRFSSYPISLA